MLCVSYILSGNATQESKSGAALSTPTPPISPALCLRPSLASAGGGFGLCSLQVPHYGLLSLSRCEWDARGENSINFDIRETWGLASWVSRQVLSFWASASLSARYGYWYPQSRRDSAWHRTRLLAQTPCCPRLPLDNCILGAVVLGFTSLNSINSRELDESSTNGTNQCRPSVAPVTVWPWIQLRFRRFLSCKFEMRSFIQVASKQNMVITYIYGGYLCNYSNSLFERKHCLTITKQRVLPLVA